MFCQIGFHQRGIGSERHNLITTVQRLSQLDWTTFLLQIFHTDLYQSNKSSLQNQTKKSWQNSCAYI
jgi:hypothetical protein